MSTSRSVVYGEGTDTLPRSDSEIEVDFARSVSANRDSMYQDHVGELDLNRKRRPSARQQKESTENVVQIHASETTNDDFRKEHRSARNFENTGKDNERNYKSEKLTTRYENELRKVPPGRKMDDDEHGSSEFLQFSSDDVPNFQLPRNFMSKLPTPPPPPKSPTFSFRSTIDLLPSSPDRYGLQQQIILCISTCLGPLACGFAMAFNFTKNPQELLGPEHGAWRTYVFLLGGVIGGFFSGLVLNLGRKVMLLFTMGIMSLVWLLVIFASRVWMVLTFHGTSGACTGMVLVLAQVYIAEVSTAKHRGAFSCAPLLTFQVGLLLCYLLGEFLVWRHLAIVGICTCVPFFFVTVLCVPESPRYLIYVRPNDALATLQWIRGVDTDVMDEYRDIADNSEVDRWSIDCSDFTRPTFWRPLFISSGLMFIYSMAGVNSVIEYSKELFDNISTSYMNVSYFILTSVIIVGVIISSILVDKIGRKLLLLLSLTIMAASSFTLGLFLFLKDLHQVDSYFMYQWVAEIFCVILFTFAHGTGVGPIAWVTIGEIYGTRHKWIGVTISSVVLWSSALAADVGYHKMSETIQIGGVFWFHCVVCVIGYIFILLCFRELKEQPIDDITKSFVKKHDRLIDTFITRL